MREYPIAEVFTSPQGEGQYTGTMMTFVRLAGCTVGKRYPKEMYRSSEIGQAGHLDDNMLPIYTEMCTLYDGRTFPCDTDYRKHEKLTADQILERVPAGVDRLCITGGEPLMHDLASLILEATSGKNFTVHIETSGTIKPMYWRLLEDESMWLTVSPKFGVLDMMVEIANEIKLLVDESFDWSKVPDSIKNHQLVYLQPVNGEFDVNERNLKRVMDIQKENPQYRVSLQLHKVLSHYIKELVR